MPISKNPSVFADNVRKVVKNIPVGQTKSYKDVATLAGNPKAARAVARIMANNFDLEVPCHRVIRTDGTLGGYNRGGEAAKRAILESEKTK
jgi:O-6-methylguanine DNA methyltransferase